jgi:DNA (cytosine-5)-methyltransferase 1
MKFGSVCSGIEAASVAWSPLGWQAAWLSEIEPFPSAVLAHHYPDVPNLGDMTALPERILSGEVEAPDLFCGGTPCQAFSVAGLRNSLDDSRGNLSLTFVEIANAIDKRRLDAGLVPTIVFWENVPGVLNTKDNAFGCFLGALAGEDAALDPAGGRWTNAGCVYGPERTIAWRVLDAQYFGVAQRRRRVFVVASARDDFDPAAVLFESEGVRRDTAPSREAGERIAPRVTNGPPFCRTGNERVEAEAMVVVAPVYEMHGQDSRVRDVGEVCTTVSATYGSGGGNVPITLAQSIPFDTIQITSPYNYSNPQAGDPCHPLAARAHVPAVVQPIPLNSMNCFRSPEADPSTGCGVGEQGEAMFTISKTNHHAVAQPIAWDEELNPSVDIAGTLLRGGADGRHDGVAQPIVYERHDQDARLKEVSVAPTLHAKSDNTCDLPVVLHPNTAVAYNISPGKGELKDDIHVTDAHVSKTIDASNSNPAMHQGGVAIVSPTLTASNDPSRSPQSTEVTNQVAAIHAVSMAVRRLMPVECERLQGFPDNYTNIPWRKKPESPDGPRYKALGNSWAVPVVAWIGKRIHEAVQ